MAGDVRARVPGGPGLRVCRADPAVPAAARQRGLRIPGAGVPLLGRRPGRLHRPSPVARARVEGGRDGPPGVPPPRPAVAGMAAHDPRFLPTTPTPSRNANDDRSLLKRSARRIAPLLLALGLVLSPAASPSARAQEEAPGERRVEGRPGARLPGRGDPDVCWSSSSWANRRGADAASRTRPGGSGAWMARRRSTGIS